MGYRDSYGGLDIVGSGGLSRYSLVKHIVGSRAMSSLLSRCRDSYGGATAPRHTTPTPNEAESKIDCVYVYGRGGEGERERGREKVRAHE